MLTSWPRTAFGAAPPAGVVSPSSRGAIARADSVTRTRRTTLL